MIYVTLPEMVGSLWAGGVSVTLDNLLDMDLVVFDTILRTYNKIIEKRNDALKPKGKK